MTTNKYVWLTYSEPTDNGRVQATKRITYESGPNESREDEVVTGTLPMDALEVWKDNPHVHDNDELLLSAVNCETREYIEDVFIAE